MKLSKQEFKNLLKECLTEILTEEPAVKQMFKESLIKEKQKTASLNESKTPQKKNISDIGNRALLEQLSAIESIANQFDDKSDLMKLILADTAINTVPAQRELREGYSVGNAFQEQSKEVDIESLATEDISHWAKIAFSKK